jgi:cytochrome c553
VSVLALTAGQKTGILAVALVFIAFALISSFVLPRRNPDFPARHVLFFSIVSVALFVAMLTAMVTLAKEPEEEGGHEAVAGETTGGETTGGEKTGGETTGGETTGGETTGGGEAQGDPAAGKQVFASAGCAGCHTLSDAGATGQVGPNLDEAKPPHDLVVERVTNGAGAMPSFKGQLSDEEIQNVAAYVVQATSGS